MNKEYRPEGVVKIGVQKRTVTRGRHRVEETPQQRELSFIDIVNRVYHSGVHPIGVSEVPPESVNQDPLRTRVSQLEVVAVGVDIDRVVDRLRRVSNVCVLDRTLYEGERKFQVRAWKKTGEDEYRAIIMDVYPTRAEAENAYEKKKIQGVNNEKV